MEPLGVVPSQLPIAEKLVARLWDRQQPFDLPLATPDGMEIQVVYRGRRRWDRGPDFVAALIAWPGSSLQHGDVEIHVRSTDWRAHGHHRDPHYNGVILQVVMWDDAVEPCLRQDGSRVPVVALAPHLSVPLETLMLAQERDVPPPPSSCWRGNVNHRGPLGEILDRCGMERFEARVARFESDLTCRPLEQLLYEGIADALGYSRNREPFRRLAELLPLETVRALSRRGDTGTGGRGDAATGRRGDGEGPQYPVLSPQSPALITRHSAPAPSLGLESLLLGAAGLLPSQRGLLLDEDDGYVRLLEEGWAADGLAWFGDGMRAEEWQFFRVRPANFPTRRVAALADLVERWPGEGLGEVLAGILRSLKPRLFPRVVEGWLLGGGAVGYWAHRCDFGQRLRRLGSPIGRQRAAEVAVNVLLPLLAAEAGHLRDGELGQRAVEAYRLYPKRGDNEITRYMATRIVGHPRPGVARSACRQQGLLHLYWTRCEMKRCGECPCRDADC